MNIKLSINKNLIDKGSPWTAGWQNAEMSLQELADHIRSGYAFSQGVLKDGSSDKKPGINDVLEAKLLPVDIDNTMHVYNPEKKSYDKRMKTIEEGYFGFDEAAADHFLQNFAAFIYTTPSHTDAHHRFRIVFVLPEAVTDPVEYSNIAEAFIDKYDSDKSCKNIDRMFFGSRDCQLFMFGKQLSKKEMSRIVKSSSSEQRVIRLHKNSGLNGNDISSKTVAEMLSFIPKRMGYDEWGKIVSAVGNYFDEETAIKLIDDWSPDDKMGTAYRIKHRSKKPGIASVIWLAKQNGYDIRQLYHNDYSDMEISKSGELVNKKSGLKEYQMTEVGNSERFLDQWGHMLRYNHTSGYWHIWNGKQWEFDERNRIVQFAKKTIRRMYSEIPLLKSDQKKIDLSKHAIRSETRSQMNNMIEIANSFGKIALIQSEFDKDPYVFNLKNGTYNLKTNEFMEHDPKDHLSKIADVEFVHDANCYLFEDSLLTIFNNNTELIKFVQRAVGLSLCGAHLEEVLFFCYGSGKNGKSVFFKVLQSVFGDYFQKAPTEMLMLKINESIPNDVARLPGARFVAAEELPENRSFNENRLKNLTGGDKITARFLHKEFFEFMPTHTLWIYGNHKPTIKGADEGIWRRICLIPFNVTIPESERRPQHELMADFELEKSGILNWILQGWKEYQKIGLQPPDAVKEATKEYRDEMDMVGDFIGECCDLNDPAYKIKSVDLYKVYMEWCKSTNEYVIPKKKFFSRIILRDGVSTEIRRGDKIFTGIDLNNKYKEQLRAF